MINNRQAGRRRGRNNNNNNGPRQNGGGGNRGNGDSGNRIDNRARGNATQLLEKYRNMARDAQLIGDRVNMEYYLQFADHYFRVLADNRARQEENQQGGQQRFQRFDGNDQDEEFGPDDDGFGDLPEVGGRQRDDFRRDDNRDDTRRDDNRGNREQANGNRETPRAARDDQRPPRDEPRANRDDQRGPRDDNRGNPDEPRAARDEPRANRDNRRPVRERAPERPVVQPQAEAPVAQDAGIDRNDAGTPVFAGAANDEGRDEAPVRAPRGRKPRRVADAIEPQESGLDAAVLPPSIGRPIAVGDEDEAPVAPVRRTRRPRAPAQAAE